MSGLPLVWRLFAANAAVLCLAGLVLVVSPVTVSSPVLAWELACIVGGLVIMLLGNLWLVRRALTPLDRLRREMDHADLLRPGRRAAIGDAPDPDVAALAEAFDAMLARLEAERRQSAARAISAQEDERRRVARELHDGVGQTLTGLLLQLDRASRTAPEAIPGLEEAREDARTSLEEVRRIARQLRPAALDDLGLVSALEALATSVARATDLVVTRRFARDLPPLAPDVELALYRVAQESLANVARHAQAEHVELRLDALPGGVRLAVADDGRGFAGVDRASGGLRWMRERAVLAGGTIEIRSHPGAGTTIALDVPRADEALRGPPGAGAASARRAGAASRDGR